MALRGLVVLASVLAAAQPSLVRRSTQARDELEQYIAAKRPELNLRYRPHYHVAPPVGWMNDPNGFSFYKGEYHIFYQFYPYDAVWGPMHWGHSASPDLVSWRTLPTALLPDREQCFSGSAVVDGDTLVLMYTAHEVIDHEPFYNETQFLATSDDGVDFTKYPGNPVLPAAPNGSPDFRDPKVWKHEDHWYAVLGSKTDDERGRVLLYRSENLIEWEFLRVLGESPGDLGYMWECPDFFELGGKHVLLWSPQGMDPAGDRYRNLHQTGYIIGDFDYVNFEFVQRTKFQELDYGHDFYASQTMERDGRRYVLAWFNMWEQPHPEEADGWAGALTLVRELQLQGDVLLQRPLDEMLGLRTDTVFDGLLDTDQLIEFEQTGEIILSGDLAQRIDILIAGRHGGEVALRWVPEVGKVVVDREGDVRQVEWTPVGAHSWRLFLDASSLELFCGEGEVVFSTRVYPAGGWQLANRSPQPLRVEAYKLRRSVPL